MSTIRSFDVFDTLLTRRVGSPGAVFDVLAVQLSHQGLVSPSPTAFAASRRRYDQQLTRFRGRHATLREIYDEVARALSADASLVERWASAEEELERSLIVAVPGAQRAVAEARARADQVVFVSDTPHTEEFLTEVLVAQGLAKPDDRVFTSAARGATKALGGLFQAISDELGPGHTFEHFGDNRRSDVAAPRIEGWHGHHLPDAQLSKYEELLEAFAGETSSFTSWLAGASRIARLEARERGVAGPVADVASGSLAPFLVGYALWTLAQARLRGIKRLYYVARDGEVMMRVAQQVIGRLAPDIEIRYLYGSRQPWILAASAYSDDVLRRWITVATDFTARTALARVRLTPEQVHAETQLPYTHPDRADAPLLPAEREELVDRLLQEPLGSLVRAAAQDCAERAIEYMRQEGLYDDVPTALVDAGWGGRTARAFDVLQEAAGGARVTHLFVGMTGHIDDAPEHAGVDVVPWLFNQQIHPDSVRGLQSPNVLVEMFCAGTVGRTTDYVSDGHRMVPVLNSPINEPVVAWGIREVHDIAVRVAELVREQLPIDAGSIDCAPFAWEALRAFWTTPSSSEVAAWGTFPWEEELADPFQPVAERVTTTSVVRRVLRGDRSLRRNNSWRAGTARRSGQPWRSMLQSKAWVDEQRPRLARAPRRLRLELAQRRGAGKNRRTD